MSTSNIGGKVKLKKSRDKDIPQTEEDIFVYIMDLPNHKFKE